MAVNVHPAISVANMSMPFLNVVEIFAQCSFGDANFCSAAPFVKSQFSMSSGISSVADPCQQSQQTEGECPRGIFPHSFPRTVKGGHPKTRSSGVSFSN